MDTKDGTISDAPDPIAVVSMIEELPENTMVILRDIHLFFVHPDAFLIRALKDLLRNGKPKGKTMILIGCRHLLPPELEREFVVVDCPLPERDELGSILDAIAHSSDLEKAAGDARDLILDAASGLTSIEAENAFALSIAQCGRLESALVAQQKAIEVAKGGLLEIYPPQENLESVGGLEDLKKWLEQRRNALSQRARDYGLPSPKGLLIIGIPGTGKSLVAKATAAVFQRPLLKLDTGRLFGGLVGQSEGNLRSVIATAEAISPCVLWIDEIEKGLAGGKSSGTSDGGTSARVFGSLLSWMQEKTKPLFVVATANDVSQLPPELLRKGRFDELFFVDLPSPEERELIWQIQIAKHGRNPKDYDTVRLSGLTEGWTGSEIEQAFIEGLYDSFSRDEEPNDRSLEPILRALIPLSKLMSQQIGDLRQWAKGRARCASNTTQIQTTRRILSSN
jgi:AAA+ superfamily predicted ATPase